MTIASTIPVKAERRAAKAYVEWEDRIGRRLPLWDLTVLQTCIDVGSISKAAEAVRLSKPAISKILRGLEQEVGAELVSRSWRGLEPTEACRILLARSDAALAALHSAVDSINLLSSSTTGELRIAANEVGLSGLIGDVIASIHERYPGIVFEIVPAYTRTAQLHELERGNVEVVVGQIADIGHQIEATELFQDRLVVAAGENSRWVKAKAEKLADLINDPWAFSPLDTVSGRTMTQAFRINGLGLPPVMVVGSSMQLLRQLVMRNEFLALFPASVVERARGLVALPVEVNALWQPIGLLTMKHRTLSSLAKLFIDEIRKVVSENAARQQGIRPAPTSGR
ncbi:LysR family transcriptional regulator [Novosphingobium flavum]|uniref:LysR family transcriptional regulator n=1 Tax=Novosphingobium flavum TaxID=1778672 RepID=A0A7X1FU42_9SPHN|nr:LysR family transcriptional regulator [Novosphingobium flavum]MBC2666996.1 LysR family transcriptional regulator [Novosphingobium flavum]